MQRPGCPCVFQYEEAEGKGPAFTVNVDPYGQVQAITQFEQTLDEEKKRAVKSTDLGKSGPIKTPQETVWVQGFPQNGDRQGNQDCDERGTSAVGSQTQSGLEGLPEQV